MTENNPYQFREGGVSTRSAMREVVRRYEHKIPREEYLRVWSHVKPNGRVDNTHATTLAVKDAQDPRMKARLLPIYVQDQTENYADDGGRARAIGMMAKADVANLPRRGLAHLNEDFAFGQYDAAVEDKNMGDAWRIARTMVTKREKIVKPKESPTESDMRHDEHQKNQWDMREKSSFARYTDRVLRSNNSATDIVDDSEIKMIFSRMTQREDNGFQGEQVSHLATEVARRVIHREIDNENLNFALLYAQAAGIPQEIIGKIADEPERMQEIFDEWREPAMQAEIITVFDEASEENDRRNEEQGRVEEAQLVWQENHDTSDYRV